MQFCSQVSSRKYLVGSAIVSALGGLLFGFDTLVISGAIHDLTVHFHLDAAATGWAAGCAIVGCIFGAASAGSIADAFGRKKTLAICAACFAASSIGIWFAANLAQFALWRIVAGLGVGASSIIAPMYIAEIAPARHRGRLVTLYQMGIVVGILAAVLSNMLIERMGSDAWNAATGWRLMFLAGVVPALLFAAMIAPSVESPRWLMKAGRTREAERVLHLIHDASSARAEAREIQESLNMEEGKLSELLTTFRRPLLLGIMLAGLQQISGITPLFSYLPDVFRQAGAATANAFSQSVLVSLVNLGATLIALWLIDQAGRKTLIVGGTTVQFLSFVLVGWLYFIHGSTLAVLAFVMLFVAGHAAGNGVAMWVIIAEIYPTKVRGRAMSIATTALWVVCYLLIQIFPIMQQDIGPAMTFWCFAGGALLTIILVAWLVPETKDKSLEEITRFWKGNESVARLP